MKKERLFSSISYSREEHLDIHESSNSHESLERRTI